MISKYQKQYKNDCWICNEQLPENREKIKSSDHIEDYDDGAMFDVPFECIRTSFTIVRNSTATSTI